jgi:hypothetical protein
MWGFKGFKFPLYDCPRPGYAARQFQTVYHEPVENTYVVYWSDFISSLLGRQMPVPISIHLPLNFTAAEFESALMVENIVFEQGVCFRGALFRNLVTFDRVKFKGQLNLRESVFERGVEVSNATFVSRMTPGQKREYSVEMRFAQFPRAVEVVNPTFQGTVRWRWPGTGLRKSSEGRPAGVGTLVFKNLKPQKDSYLDIGGNDLSADEIHLRFDNCRMHNVLFGTTDASQIEFLNCTWPKEQDKVSLPWRGRIGDRRLWGERQAVADELMFIKKYPKYPRKPEHRREKAARLIRQTYQQLSEIYGKNSDKVMSVEFDRGAFEMRRREEQAKKPFCLRPTAWWLWFYKHTSHYSGNLFVLSLWIVFSIVISATVYSAIEDYRCLWPGNWDHYAIDTDKIQLALRIPAIDRSWFGDLEHRIQPGGTKWFLVQLYSLVQSIITVTLLTLFGLAMRRKFKH